MKYLLTAMLVMIMAVTSQAQNYTRNGKEFSKVTTVKKTKEDRDTGFTYKDSNGTVYPIYMSESGSCYIKRVSKKTGKEYKSYLGPEISSQICGDLGVDYKGKPAGSE